METTLAQPTWWATQVQKARAIPPMVRLYRVGLALMVAAMVLALFRASPTLGSAVFVTGASACAGSVAFEFYGWTEKQSTTLWFKVLFSVIAIMSGAIATGAAATYVAAGTGQEAGTFKLAITLLAPMAFVPLLCFGIGIMGIFAVPVVMALTMGQDIQRPAEKKGFVVSLIGRMMGVIALATIAMQVPTHSSGIDDGLRDIGAKAAYFLDMQRHPRCSSDPSDRVARVNDDLVIVGRQTAAGVVFTQVSCPLVADDHPLPQSARPTH